MSLSLDFILQLTLTLRGVDVLSYCNCWLNVHVCQHASNSVMAIILH